MLSEKELAEIVKSTAKGAADPHEHSDRASLEARRRILARLRVSGGALREVERIEERQLRLQTISARLLNSLSRASRMKGTAEEFAEICRTPVTRRVGPKPAGGFENIEGAARVLRDLLNSQREFAAAGREDLAGNMLVVRRSLAGDLSEAAERLKAHKLSKEEAADSILKTVDSLVLVDAARHARLMEILEGKYRHYSAAANDAEDRVWEHIVRHWRSARREG